MVAREGVEPSGRVRTRDLQSPPAPLRDYLAPWESGSGGGTRTRRLLREREMAITILPTPPKGVLEA